MKNFPLVLIAAFLALIIMPIASCYGFIRASFKLELAKYLITVSIAIDQAGNVVCKYLFNDTLIKDNAISFGNEDETISSTLGRNLIENNLTLTGKVLQELLDRLDKDHCINSIEINP